MRMACLVVCALSQAMRAVYMTLYRAVGPPGNGRCAMRVSCVRNVSCPGFIGVNARTISPECDRISVEDAILHAYIL